MPIIAKTLETRFFEKVDKMGPFPTVEGTLHPEMGRCWVWTGHVNPKTQYGQIYVRRLATGKKQFASAHRLVFLLTAGKLPDAGKEPDHLCKNRRCVRPDHLELVTHQVNAQRRTPKYCKRGHLFEGNMVKNGKSGRTCRQCKYESEARYKGKHPTRAQRERTTVAAAVGT